MTQWFLLEDEEEYKLATKRFEEIQDVKKGMKGHKEKMLLAYIINKYEKERLDLPEVDPIEMIKIRMEDFGFTATDLAREYGDKGTISKVLNYKQALSLTMIRKFSKLLHISADILAREYDLRA